MAIKWRRVLALTCGAVVGAAVLLLGAGLLAQRFPGFLQYRMSVLGGPGPGDKLLGPLAREWETEHRFVRLAPASGRIEDNARRLAAGEGDMAIVRGDDPAATGLRMLYQLQQLGLVVLLPPDSAIETGADLKGRKIALLGADADDRMLTAAFAMLGIDAKEVSPVEPKGLGAAMRAGRASAAAALVPLSVRSPMLVEAAQSIARSYRDKPSFLDISEAAAIAAAHPLYSADEITPSVFGAAVADPSETVSTLSVNILLVARARMPNRIAGEIAGALTALRSRMLVAEPGIAQIGPPDLEVAGAIAVHPGVKAYLNGDQPSIAAEAVNLYWIAGAVIAIVSPLLAVLVGWIRDEPPGPCDRERAKAAKLLQAAATAEPDELARIEARLSQLMDELVEALAQGAMEGEEFLAIEALIRHASARVAERRSPSATSPRPTA